MVNANIRDKLIEFKKVNGRISWLIIKNEIADFTLINIYAPIETANDEGEGKFYDITKGNTSKDTKHDTIIAVGDLKTTDNGARLCNRASETGMYIMSTKFNQEKEHKIKWNIPGELEGNQINHVLITKKRENMIQDVRSFRGTSVNTDYQLLIIKMKLRLVRSNKKNYE